MNFHFHLKSKGTNPKAQLKHLNSGTRKNQAWTLKIQSGETAGWLVFYWPPLQPDSFLLPHLLSRTIMFILKISEDKQQIPW